MVDITEIRNISARNQKTARKVIEDSGVVEAWKSVGAEPYLVGSLRLGLLMLNRDIDFHIYSGSISVGQSFAAMARLSANPSVERVEYSNLLETEEECLEWHAWYRGSGGELWQLDMIHIRKGSFFDGYVEKVGDRIADMLTDETRDAILRLKYETPADKKIGGILYYRAVLEGGVRDFSSFRRWMADQPVSGTHLWMPGE